MQRQRLHKTHIGRKIRHAQNRNCTANAHSYRSHSWKVQHCWWWIFLFYYSINSILFICISVDSRFTSPSAAFTRPNYHISLTSALYISCPVILCCQILFPHGRWFLLALEARLDSCLCAGEDERFHNKYDWNKHATLPWGQFCCQMLGSCPPTERTYKDLLPHVL